MVGAYIAEPKCPALFYSDCKGQISGVFRDLENLRMNLGNATLESTTLVELSKIICFSKKIFTRLD